MSAVDYQGTNQLARSKAAVELQRRGLRSVKEARDFNRRVLKAAAPDGREWTFIIKSKTKGSWQGTITDGAPDRAQSNVLWIFVDLGGNPDFFVVPDKWIRQDIKEHHEAYLKRNGGKRARGGDSLHHMIHPDRVASWKDRWDLIEGERAGR